MKRIMLDIRPDAATRAFYAPSRSGDYAQELQAIADKVRNEGIEITKRNDETGFLQLRFPADWQLHALPADITAWLASLLERGLEYDFDHIDGFRPEALIPDHPRIKRDMHNTVYWSLKDKTFISDRTLYFASFEDDCIGYFFHNSRLWVVAKINWPSLGGDCWRAVEQMPDDVDLLDLLHISENDLL